jgi:predicted nuclease with TOPRIM domain
LAKSAASSRQRVHRSSLESNQNDIKRLEQDIAKSPEQADTSSLKHKLLKQNYDELEKNREEYDSTF